MILQGPNGDTGSTGKSGSRGPRGRDGRTGSTGERGDDGDVVNSHLQVILIIFGFYSGCAAERLFN